MKALLFASFLGLISTQGFGAVKATQFSVTLDPASSKALYDALTAKVDQLTFEGGGGQLTKALSAAGIKCTRVTSVDFDGKVTTNDACTVSSN